MQAPADLDAILAALSDPTRRAILERLGDAETRVTDLAAPFPMSLNAVSKHIRVLEEAGLVHRRRAGREHWLSLERTPLAAAATWIEQRRNLWSSRLEELEALLEAEQAEPPGGFR
jgi:DNA-binding transcriptional ArsR family regulator